MKKSFLTVLTLLTVVFCYAQINPAPVQVAESERSLVSKGVSSNSLRVDIPGTSDKIALKVWKSFVKDHGAKAKKQKKSGEWYSEGAKIESVNNESPVNITAKVDESPRGASLTLWIGIEEDIYISSAAFPNDYAGAESFLDEYVKEVNRELVRMELDDEEKKLKKLRNELKKLERQNKGYHKDIENAKKKITKSEVYIETNIVDQDKSRINIEGQTQTVDAVSKKYDEEQSDTAKDELKDEEKKLKKLKNELKRLKRQNKGYHKDIDNAKNKSIPKAEENIKINLVEQEEAKSDIEDQILAVEAVRKKLEDI